MKYSTLIILCGFVFSQPLFAQNNGQNPSKCYTKNSNNNAGCQVKTQQKAVKNQQKVIVKTPPKVVVIKSAPKVVVIKPAPKVVVIKPAPKVVVIKPAPIGSNLVLQTQQQLNRLGYNAGPADGLMGKRTRDAIILFQKRNNLHIDGQNSSKLLVILKKANHQ